MLEFLPSLHVYDEVSLLFPFSSSHVICSSERLHGNVEEMRVGRGVGKGGKSKIGIVFFTEFW